MVVVVVEDEALFHVADKETCYAHPCPLRKRVPHNLDECGLPFLLPPLPPLSVHAPHWTHLPCCCSPPPPPIQVCSTPVDLISAMQNLDVAALKPYIKPGTTGATAAAGIATEITRIVGFAPKD